MSTEPIPNDRAVQNALRKLKAYSAYKGRQSQMSADRSAGVDRHLATVEIWARDASDDGQVWAQRRRAIADQDEKLAQRWRQAVERDEAEAAREAEERQRVSMDQVKDELKRQIDEHAAAIGALAEAKEPGFRGKLSKVRSESARAKKFLDENLVSAMDDAAKRTAAERRQRKEVAQLMEQRAQVGRDWRGEYEQQPSKFPAGQRDDAREALQRIGDFAADRAEELAVLGGQGAPLRERLGLVRAWASESGNAVDQTEPALPRAKGDVLAGVETARNTFAELDALGAKLEREANENFAIFRRWTAENTARAKKWIHSDSVKHREWAEAWLGRRAKQGRETVRGAS